MCLDLNKETTRRFRHKFVNGKMTCYKVLTLEGSSSIYPMTYKYGWNISDRPDIHLTFEEDKYDEVRRGIHVYTNKKIIGPVGNWSVIVPVTCCLKDLVGYGHQEAVFMKVFINKKNWKKYCHANNH